MNPLNIRRHYHLTKKGPAIFKKSADFFSSKKEANTFALNAAKAASNKKGLPYKGGPFGNDGLAFYAVGDSYIEVVPCDKIGTGHQ